MLEDRLNDIDTIKVECDSGCKTMEYKEIDVTVPVTIEPYACIGDVCVEIIDDPCIIPVPSCMRKHNCQYAVKQKLCVIFPIKFDAVASLGDPICSLGGNCECGCNTDCDNDCNRDRDNDCNYDYEEQMKDRLKESIKTSLLNNKKLKSQLKKFEVERFRGEHLYRGQEYGVNKTNNEYYNNKIKGNEEDLESLFGYRTLGNYLQIFL